MDILTALYEGNIDPRGRNTDNSKEYKQHLATIEAKKKQIQGLVSPEAYQLINELESLYTDEGEFEEKTAFKFGVRFATLLMVDAFANSKSIIGK